MTSKKRILCLLVLAVLLVCAFTIGTFAQDNATVAEEDNGGLSFTGKPVFLCKVLTFVL